MTELSPVMIHLPRPAQLTIAASLYPLLLAFVRECPKDIVDLYRHNRRLEGDPSSLFDVCFTLVGDGNTLTAKKGGSFWPFMALLLGFCPDIVLRIVDGDVDGGRSGMGSLGKKVCRILRT